MSTALVTQLTEMSHPILTAGDPSDPGLVAAADGISGAQIVALGLSVRGVRPIYEHQVQQSALAHRLLEEHGFDTIAIEDTAELGQILDRCIRLQSGELREKLSGVWAAMRTTEFVGLLEWAQERNATSGKSLIRVIGLNTDTKAPPGDFDGLAAAALLEAAAQGRKIVYLAGAAHAARLAASNKDGSDEKGQRRPVGQLVSEKIGNDYKTVVFTLGSSPGERPVSAPSPGRVEFILNQVKPGCFWLKTSESGGVLARAWLSSPMALRCVGPAYDPEEDDRYTHSAASLKDCFDLVVHCRLATPATYFEA